MGSSVKQCSKCKKLFQSFGSSVCPECVEEMDRYFETVKNHLFDHPYANVTDIAKETGIAEKIILGFLREGRLSLNCAEGDMLECEKCGAPISHGRFCAICQCKLQGLLGGACKPDSPKSEGMGKLSGTPQMFIKK